MIGRQVMAVTAVLALLAVPVRGAETDNAPQAVPMVALNFADSVDVRVLARLVSEVTGETFAYDEDFSGTVMLETPREIPESALMPVFESVLKLKGYTLVRRQGLVMIVQNAAATALDTGIVLPAREVTAEGTEFVTRIASLRHAEAETVRAAIEPFLSSGSSARVLPGQQEVAISDYAENVQRALEIIAHLDRPQARPRVSLIGLEHARAKDLAAQLELAFRKDKGSAELPLFAADQRTNSLVVVAREADVAAIRELTGTLDVEAVAPELPIRVYRLMNTKAETVLPMLEELLRGIAEVGRRSEPAEAGQGFGEGPANGLAIKIVGDTQNNALLVAAAPDEHEWLADVVRELDQRRAQVLLEAWLVSLNDRAARELGVELEARGSRAGTDVRAGSFFGLSAFDEDTGERGVPVPNAEGGTVAVLRPGELTAILNALERSETGRIVSRPRVLANANEEATFRNVRSEPFVTISAITASTSTTSFGGYETAGTELTITPTILEGDYVYLDVFLSVSNFTGQAPSEQVPPPRDENSIKTGVAVPDEAAIVIGGIVQTQELETITKVPLLGDIPLLGLLFRSKRNSTTQNTLYAFIRPRIFRADDFSDLVEASAEAEAAASPQAGHPSTNGGADGER